MKVESKTRSNSPQRRGERGEEELKVGSWKLKARQDVIASDLPAVAFREGWERGNLLLIVRKRENSPQRRGERGEEELKVGSWKLEVESKTRGHCEERSNLLLIVRK